MNEKRGYDPENKRKGKREGDMDKSKEGRREKEENRERERKENWRREEQSELRDEQWWAMVCDSVSSGWQGWEWNPF